MSYLVNIYEVKNVCTEKDLAAQEKYFQRNLEAEISEFATFKQRAIEHTAYVAECMQNGNYTVYGFIAKNHRLSGLRMYLRFPDKSQTDFTYPYEKMAEVHNRVNELKIKYANGDWSLFNLEER